MERQNNTLQKEYELTQTEKEKVITELKSGVSLNNFNKTIRGNKEIALEAVAVNPWNISHTLIELKDDIDIIKTAINQRGIAIQYASERLKNNPEIIQLALKNELGSFKKLTNEMKSNFEFVSLELRKNSQFYFVLSPEQSKNETLIKSAIYNSDFQTHTNKDILKSLHNNYLSIDMKSELNKLTEYELGLIHKRTLLATLTYQTSNLDINKFIPDYNKKFHSFKSEYVLIKYMDDYLNNNSDIKGFNNSVVHSKYKTSQEMFEKDINDKLENKYLKEIFKTIDYDSFQKYLFDTRNGDVLNTKTLDTDDKQTVLSIYETMKDKNIKFYADDCDLYLKNGMTIDIKTSLMDNNTYKVNVFEPYNKEFTTNTLYPTPLKDKDTDTFITNKLNDNKGNNGFCIYQSYGVYNKPKDIIVQSFYDTVNDKLYLTSVINKKSMDGVASKEGLVGNIKAETLQFKIKNTIPITEFLSEMKNTPNYLEEFNKTEFFDKVF